MTCNKKTNRDKMIETQLKEYSNKLNIPIDELIERYVKRGIYRDKYYEQCIIPKEKIRKILKIDKNSNKKQEKYRKEDPMDALVDIYIYPEE